MERLAKIVGEVLNIHEEPLRDNGVVLELTMAEILKVCKEFKSINANLEDSNDSLKSGVYFKSDNDNSTQYLIELCRGTFDGNALVKIYTTTSFVDGLASGDEYSMHNYDLEWIAEVDLCGKYFFPKFNNELQLYYDDEKYYKGSRKTNSISSLMEAINFAIEYGLKESGIVPY